MFCRIWYWAQWSSLSTTPHHKTTPSRTKLLLVCLPTFPYYLPNRFPGSPWSEDLMRIYQLIFMTFCLKINSQCKYFSKTTYRSRFSFFSTRQLIQCFFSLCFQTVRNIFLVYIHAWRWMKRHDVSWRRISLFFLFTKWFLTIIIPSFSRVHRRELSVMKIIVQVRKRIFCRIFIFHLFEVLKTPLLRADNGILFIMGLSF